MQVIGWIQAFFMRAAREVNETIDLVIVVPGRREFAARIKIGNNVRRGERGTRDNYLGAEGQLFAR